LDEKKAYIEEIVVGLLPDETYFLVRVEVTGHEGKEKVSVFIDGDHGISVDICSKVSRKLSEVLESSGRFPGSYTLEVSSPGIDFPLQSERQYRKNIGRTIKVKKTDGTSISGELGEVNEVGITLRLQKSKKTDIEDQFIDYNQIQRSNVIVTFK